MSHPPQSSDRPAPPSPAPASSHTHVNEDLSQVKPGHSVGPKAGPFNYEAHRQASTTALAPRTDRATDHYNTSPVSTAQSTPSKAQEIRSILNPSVDVSQHGSYPLQRLVSSIPTSIPSPRSRKRDVTASPTTDAQPAPLYDNQRRGLTPKSPRLRAMSVGATSLPPIQASPRQIASEVRYYTVEPGADGIPALPPLAANVPRSLPPLQPPEQQFPPLGAPHPSGSMLGGPSYNLPPVRDSGHSQMPPRPSESISPILRYNAPPLQPNHPTSYRPQLMSGPHRQDALFRGSAEGFQTGGPSYQMTLETDQGPVTVPVEVDVSQASKVASEKRKRNAGASARFRARRKEKEKEASHTISSLKQELREARSERDFYRDERDFFRDFAARQVGMTNLPPRPPSPVSQFATTMSPSSDNAGPEEQEQRARSDSGPSVQRRRTGDYQPAFSPTEHPGPAHYDQPYHGPPPGLALPPPTQLAGPHVTGNNATGPPPMAPRSQSSYDPFRRDYFDRR